MLGISYKSTFKIESETLNELNVYCNSPLDTQKCRETYFISLVISPTAVTWTWVTSESNVPAK